MNYLCHLVVYLEIYLLLALSLNLLVGYTGLLSLAQAGYFGLGAYVAALLQLRLQIGFPPALLAGVFIAAAASVLVSLPALRFRGDYFVLNSLAVQIALFSMMLNSGLTGGPYGLAGIPPPQVTATDPKRFALVYGIVVALAILNLSLLKRSFFGRSLQALRDDELAARSLGVPVGRLKAQVFLVASAAAGLAGALYASYLSYIDPSSFNLDSSIVMLSMVIIGGTGNTKGPFVGACIVILVPELLRWLSLPSSVAASLQLLIYGLLLVALMRWRPSGIAGEYRFE